MAAAILLYGIDCASEELQPRKRYEIIRPVYVMGVYNSLNNRKLSKETARAYLHSEKYANKSYTAFHHIIPTGTIMTIIGPTPKPWYYFFLDDHYFVKLEPDLAFGLDTEITLDRGMEGSLDGLNPEIFKRLTDGTN